MSFVSIKGGKGRDVSISAKGKLQFEGGKLVKFCHFEVTIDFAKKYEYFFYAQVDFYF